jgi:hypothetical protein
VRAAAVMVSELVTNPNPNPNPDPNQVIVFYSMHPSSELDKMSLHGGCDVLNGTKYSANFWLWNEVLANTLTQP